jgi:tellurite resistance protein
MSRTVSPHEALIYLMVTMSAVDREMSDSEMRRIGSLVKNLPAFRDFDAERLVTVAEQCGDILSTEDGLTRILDLAAASLPEHLYETAYAVAVDIAAVDLNVGQEELRFLQLLRDRLDLDKLVCAAIERGARARYRTL